MMKKTTAVLLALLLAASCAVSLLTGCAKNDTEQGQSGNDGENEGENGGSEPEFDPLTLDSSPNIPSDLKFDGEAFNLLIGSTGAVLYAEEENSDLMNDTVYRRNKQTEDRFGITLNIVKSGFDATGTGQGNTASMIRSLIEGGDTTYHAIVNVQHGGMPQMVLEHYFVDWNTLPYINKSEKWWYQNILDDLCFGDKIYQMTGDYANYLAQTNCLVFNKDVFDELEIEYPYQDVLDGTWTFDKFADLVKQGAKDLDGNGIMEKGVDRWGLAGWGYEMDLALLVASGYRPLEKDADNMPILNQNVDATHEIFQRIVDIFADGQSAFSELDSWDNHAGAWSSGRLMFYDTFLGYIPNYSEVEFNFGIIPYPKWDEDSDYLSRSSNMTPLTYIPVTNTNLELTGAVLEEMAFLSAKTVTPTFFDTVLTVKSTRDVESEKMLPIIRDSARFLYTGYAPNISEMVKNKTNTYTSTFNANLTTYQNDLETMRELLLEAE